MTDTDIDPAARKAALRTLTYGLYALGTTQGAESNLATVNWLTQVSFEPSLVALSVENDSHSIEMLRTTGVFALSVFGSDQRELAGTLGKRWKLRPDKIEGARHRPGVTGCPIVEDALAALECRVTGSIPAGDSTLFVGEIIHAEMLNQGAPLTMQEAGFRHAG
ncbi:MAG: flavin reductase family protein [Chloroflexota bacterium]